jgi:hypothetical protein
LPACARAAPDLHFRFGNTNPRRCHGSAMSQMRQLRDATVAASARGRQRVFLFGLRCGGPT